MTKLDFSTDFGKRALDRLHKETVAWLTTINGKGEPVPTPVWFLWQDDALIIYSQPNTGKIRAIAATPHVVLHLNSGPDGNDVVIVQGTAEVDPSGTPVMGNRAYLDKYGEEIVKIGFTAERFATEYSEVVKITPTRLRGW